MDLLLQFWGGGCYLLNKIFFALAEGKREQLKRRLRMTGWSLYILGVPAWVVILIGKHDWIAAAIEAGGLPAMLLGLLNACREPKNANSYLDRIVTATTYSALLFGIGYSLYDYGGITAVSQILEIGVMIGFLLGSYLLAKKNSSGWLFFMLMNLSMASLMLLQNRQLLTIQQLISLCFVIYGYSVAVKSSSRSR